LPHPEDDDPARRCAERARDAADRAEQIVDVAREMRRHVAPSPPAGTPAPAGD